METVDRSRTPLLALITYEAMDRDYQVAAGKRAQSATGTDRRASRTAVVLVVACFALMVTVAAVQTSQNADVQSASRTSLIERIEVRRERVAGLQQQAAQLREDNAEAQVTLRRLGSAYNDVQARRTRIGAWTGFEPVTGDGVRVTVDNPAYAEENDVLRDSDLALLADALWAAGAEAIAINGQRLTATSGIRTSGDAVEVNKIGVAPPYTVSAIGNPGTLSSELLEAASGQQFLALVNRYGFSYEVDNVDGLKLPAAPSSQRSLREATRLLSPRTDGGGTG
ncbi:DUF881 domain-containing protein [Nocardioides sp. zg-ZUI104]|uniref:DUF881 domain-containing protein n=1 Tax=Nocardioides faecalis TaxID=2803858 RepID=UPI001BCBEC23|nr:DUF881 domain-containing protein [Nocardioides faecalis]MBS4753780.1 DUF881 domain-containing protein [Nocardioides faecalis]